MYLILAVGAMTLFAVWRLVVSAIDHELRKEWNQEAPQNTARTERTAPATGMPANVSLYRAGS